MGKQAYTDGTDATDVREWFVVEEVTLDTRSNVTCYRGSQSNFPCGHASLSFTENVRECIVFSASSPELIFKLIKAALSLGRMIVLFY